MSIKKANAFQYFIPSDYTFFIEKIREFIASPECGVILSAPYSGIERRIDQLIQDYQSQFSHTLIRLDLDMNVEDISSIHTRIHKYGYKLGKESICLLFTGMNYCLRSKNALLLKHLVQLGSETPQTKVVMCFESDITSPENRDILHSTHIFAQTYYFPLLSREDSMRFITYLTKQWQISLSTYTANKIVTHCGGHMLLIKHAVREYRRNPLLTWEAIQESSEMLFRVRLIVETLSEAEKSILLSGQEVSSHTSYYLTKVGLLHKRKCTVPLITQYLARRASARQLQLESGIIYYKELNLKQLFAPQEHEVLRLLLQRMGSVVSRDDIAFIMWRNQAYDKHSVWAIEQLIKRLRIKLTGLGFAKTYIQTVYGVGYKIGSYS